MWVALFLKNDGQDARPTMVALEPARGLLATCHFHT